MADVDKKDLEKFISRPVKVCIYGEQDEDMAPWLEKEIQKLAFCPDETHLRIYFDNHYFFAVPLTSRVTKDDNKWTAYDQEAGLHYGIKC